MDSEKKVSVNGNGDVSMAHESKAQDNVADSSPNPNSSIQSGPSSSHDDTSSLTATAKPPPSASTVGTEVPPSALNNNASVSQKRNSLLAVPTRTSSTKNTAEQSPTSTSSTAVTASGDADPDADAASTNSRKRRRGGRGGSKASSVTGTGGRNPKQGGIGRFFGFLCCRAGSSGENDPGSRKAEIRPGSVPSRRATPVVGKDARTSAKDSSIGESKDAVINEKIASESGESEAKPESSAVPPVVLNAPVAEEKDGDKIKPTDGDVLVGREIIVKDESAAETSGASDERRLPLLDAPTVTVEAPTPTGPSNEKDDISTSEPGPAPSPEKAPEAPIVQKEEDVEMKDAAAADIPQTEEVRKPITIELPPPRTEAPQHEEEHEEADNDSDAGRLVETPTADDRQQWLLPPIAPRFEGKKCLVLDLDETLVHSSFKVLHQADFTIPVEIEGNYHNVYVIKRPGVDQFMKRVGELYEVVVFTASVSKYGDPLLDQLDIHHVVHHRLFRESCFNHQGNYVKDLSQLGRDLKDTIIIDNSPTSYIFHPQHAVPISSWFSDAHDNELLDLIPVLEDLSTQDVNDVTLVLDVSL
ncbi:uncharacterized protein H6S33_003467 [Morchella sextelata]|uniref:uncharacterized protein n=1 Tax=Morchella sextelata TaxID=1174677 RepID=UPI001D0572C1|nr:uncharacterized protein H6S33_003467 [Morchella sextelata]KAH0606633.1 hypothetical protein H6S33_003467 [Morchella sextelata]